MGGVAATACGPAPASKAGRGAPRTRWEPVTELALLGGAGESRRLRAAGSPAAALPLAAAGAASPPAGAACLPGLTRLPGGELGPRAVVESLTIARQLATRAELLCRTVRSAWCSRALLLISLPTSVFLRTFGVTRTDFSLSSVAKISAVLPPVVPPRSRAAHSLTTPSLRLPAPGMLPERADRSLPGGQWDNQGAGGAQPPRALQTARAKMA
mmetsp:Transcript_52892/g.166115  ORF Transcript_52892/g.166115 Transcript_52892/m.166115 type:complete len:213 (-) Transcript_52892:2-640(-)